MPITANNLLNRAARLIRAIGSDQTLTAQEAADGLYALNSMLDAWSAERLMIYQIRQDSYSWSSGSASKTIGSGGDFNTSRPIRIERLGNFFRDSSNLDYQVSVYPHEEYSRIIKKSSGGSIPESLFYDDSYPTRTLYVYPVPSQTLTLYLNTWKPLQQFSSLTSQINLPPAYQAAIEFNLGLWWAPEWGAAAVAASKDIKEHAVNLKAAIKGVNSQSMVARVDEVTTASSLGDIESDS